MASSHSGLLVQSTFGGVGNYELVVPSALGGLLHGWRDPDVAGQPWKLDRAFGSGGVAVVSLIFTNAGMLEAVSRVGDRLEYYARFQIEGSTEFAWAGPSVIKTGVSGNPALIQSGFGGQGNYELVVALAGGGLGHLWRDNDQAHHPWIEVPSFGTSLGQVEAVALIQSNFGPPPGHLELIARAGQDLFLFWREAVPPFAWSSPSPVFSGANGIPGFIQSRHGGKGHFELVTPVASGGLAYLFRDNDQPSLPWSAPLHFGSGRPELVSLIQGKVGTLGIGSLDAIVREGSQTVLYVRQTTPPHAWSAPVPVPLDEPLCNVSSSGEWRVPFSCEVVGIHAVLLKTGRVLLSAYKEHEDRQHGDSVVIDPETGGAVRLPIAKSLFCAGHAALPDGGVLFAGGDLSGVGSIHKFTPVGDGGHWQDLGDMSTHRWYPTVTELPDGRLFIIAGNGGGPRVNPHDCAKKTDPPDGTYEIFATTSGLEPPNVAPILAQADPYWLYPFVFLLPSGKLLIHSNIFTTFFNPSSGNFEGPSLTTQSATARTYPSEGSAVLLPLRPDASPPYRAQILLVGGAGVSCPATATPQTPATATCEMLDLEASPMAWTTVASMPHARVMPDAVLLPDRTVLVVNGSAAGVADDAVSPVFDADLFDPVSGAWTTLCAMRAPRLYHATALLLPDGRVLSAGTDKDFNVGDFHYSEYRLEIFKPPYLFRGPQPVIAGAPGQVGYGVSFDVQTPQAGTIASVALMRPGSVTHSFNMEQRHVGLTIETRHGGGLTLKAPPNANVAPPGHYMLFLVDDDGVPSVASWIHVT